MAVAMTVESGCIVVRAWGSVTVEQVFVELDRLIKEGRLLAGMNRLVILDRSARLDGFTLDALRRMRTRIHHFEAQEGEKPRYRLAIVAQEPVHRGLASLYRALWSTVPEAQVSVMVTDNVADAESWVYRLT